ncbi:hypothetical protein [Acetobacter conturbans]|uniref:Uncharacterized protein n=1 Tax=Acetobacter conturbans TaxID=1737472 RepID=A0ABX0K4A6_9PROT|nr:hypothetical protein [Acetobacter conturbans]NHN89646.1 hypothetical protein [Acetobacter conturbans]
MDKPESIFSQPNEVGGAKRPPMKEPSFVPYIAAAALLVVIWATVTFVLPGSEKDIPASTLLKNALQHWSAESSSQPGKS